MVTTRITVLLQTAVRASLIHRKYRNFQKALVHLQYMFRKGYRRMRERARNILWHWKLLVRNSIQVKWSLFANSVAVKVKIVRRTLTKFLKYLRVRFVRSVEVVQRAYRSRLVWASTKPVKALNVIKKSPFGRHARQWCRWRKLGDWEKRQEEDENREMRREEAYTFRNLKKELKIAIEMKVNSTNMILNFLIFDYQVSVLPSLAAPSITFLFFMCFDGFSL